ncbi:MAG: hypothetical protein U1E63_12965 [Burkholderiales bacterium]
MSDREQPSQPLAGIFAVLALAVGAVVVQHEALVGSRPTTSTTLTRQGGELREEVPARLWQDPFAAVRAYRRSPDWTPGKGGRVIGDVLADSSNEPLHVLIAMVNGGPYTGAEEQRRRQRYAIVSALGAVGYAPETPEKIGYVEPKGRSALPELVPFERFARLSADSSNSRIAKVVVFYFDEDVLPSARPLSVLARFREELTANASDAKLRWSVLGPGSTGGFEAVVRELKACSDCNCEGLSSLQQFAFVTSQATASDKHLVSLTNVSDGLRGDVSIERLFSRHNLRLRRATSTDSTLAEYLVNELVLRRAWDPVAIPEAIKQKQGAFKNVAIADALNKLNRIVLVSEWDTPYGRQLPVELRDALLPSLSSRERQEICPVPGEPATPYSGKCPLLFFSYLRGLDGQLPASAGSNKKDDKEQNDQSDGTKEAKDSVAKRTTIERPAGDGQVDYLRRLGQVVAQKQTDLQAHGQRISAVGVLGTDVYDKLLVLQAVRNAMPEVLAFTTDLDTELIHPAEVKLATRNLVVASPFGLSLRDELQAGHPPFRDSYETATYYATLVALEEVPEKGVRLATPPPRVFEIGRNTIVDLSDLDQRSGGSGGAGSDRTCSAAQPSACPSVHPERVLPQIPTRTKIQITLFLGLASLLLVLSFRQVLRGVSVVRNFAISSRLGRVVAAATLLMSIVLGGFSAWDIFFNDRGEPWAAMNGVSMWPTEIMRLATWVLTCLLLHKGWRDIKESNDKLTKQFLLKEPTSEGGPMVKPGLRGWWERWAAILKRRFAPWISDEAYWKEVAISEIWRRHIQPATFGERILLLCFPVGLYLGAVFALFLMLGLPVRPLRGSVVSGIDAPILALCVVSFAFLLFFVIDETRSCGSLVRRLTNCRNWPRETCEKFGQRQQKEDNSGGLESQQKEDSSGDLENYFEDWVDIEFIGRRTKMVTRLIYYPFLIMTLMMLARSAWFDNWGYPPALIIAISLGLAIAIGCAVHLRSVAENARRSAVRSLRKKLLLAQQDRECNLDGPIRTLIEWVEGYRVGAFCPFAQQTWVKALLIPVGSLSALPILDFLFLGQM